MDWMSAIQKLSHYEAANLHQVVDDCKHLSAEEQGKLKALLLNCRKWNLRQMEGATLSHRV